MLHKFIKYYLTRYTFQEIHTLFLANIFNKILIKLKYYKHIIPYQIFLNEITELNIIPKRIDNKTLNITHDKISWNIRINSSDFKVFKQIVLENEYAEILSLLNELNINNDELNIIDCGSNIGIFSAWLNSIFQGSNIICIEADNHNYLFSKSTIEKLKVKNFTLINKAVWHNSQESLAINNNFRDGQEWAKSVTNVITKNSTSVKSITLNDLYNQYFNGKHIDILKIDIEGAESKIFTHPESLSEILENTRIIAIEIHDEFNCRNLINDTLIQNGFRIKEISETTFAYKSL